VKEIKILVLQHQQRSHYKKEPGHTEVVLPLFDQKKFTLDIREIVYQDLVKKFNARGLHCDSKEDKLLLKNLLKRITECTFNWIPDFILVNRTFHNESLGKTILEEISTKLRSKCVQLFFDHDLKNKYMLEDEKQDSLASKLNIQIASPIVAKMIKQKDPPFEDWSNTESWFFMPCPVSKKLFAPKLKPKFKIGLYGSLDGDRKLTFAFLKDMKISFKYGGGIMNMEKLIDLKEYSDLVSNTQLHILNHTIEDQVKGRVFQVLSARCAPLHQISRSAYEIFQDDMLYFKSILEIPYLIDFMHSKRFNLQEYAKFLHNKYSYLSSPEFFLENILNKL